MLDNLLKLDPFSINRKEKNKIFTNHLFGMPYMINNSEMKLFIVLCYNYNHLQSTC